MCSCDLCQPSRRLVRSRRYRRRRCHPARPRSAAAAFDEVLGIDPAHARAKRGRERAETLDQGEVFVGKTISIIDILKETNQALHENRPDHYTVPEARALVAQELLLFENSGWDDLEEIADSQLRTARITLRVPSLDGVVYPAFLSRIRHGFE